jgi:hypothetical protein
VKEFFHLVESCDSGIAELQLGNKKSVSERFGILDQEAELELGNK